MTRKFQVKNKSFHFLIALILITMSFFGCETVGELSETEEAEAPFISTEEMLADYDYMWAIIDSQFPFLTEAERTGYLTQNEIIAVKEKFRKQIIDATEQFDKDPYEVPPSHVKLYPYIDSKDAIFQIFRQCLNSFRNLGHLRVRAHDFMGFDEPLSEKSERFYRSFNGTGAVEIEDENFNLEEIFSFRYVQDIPVITVKSFSDGASKHHDTLLEAVSSACDEVADGGYEHVIIDIRGNGGGSSWIWQKGMSRLFSGREKPSKHIGGLRSGCLDYFAECSSKNEHYKLYPVISEDQSLLYPDKAVSEAMQRAGLDYIVETDRTTDIVEAEKTPFQGKIWLLVDSHCASSSELLVEFCQDTGAATVVGAKTAGRGKGGYSPTYKIVELPNSGMCIEFEWISYLNSDGTFNNFEGTVPDIETNENALEVCLNLIKY